MFALETREMDISTALDVNNAFFAYKIICVFIIIIHGLITNIFLSVYCQGLDGMNEAHFNFSLESLFCFILQLWSNSMFYDFLSSNHS